MKYAIAIIALLAADPAMAQQMAREWQCRSCAPPTKNDVVLLACSQNSPTPFDLKWFDACLVREGFVKQEGQK